MVALTKNLPDHFLNGSQQLLGCHNLKILLRILSPHSSITREFGAPSVPCTRKLALGWSVPCSMLRSSSHVVSYTLMVTTCLPRSLPKALVLAPTSSTSPTRFWRPDMALMVTLTSLDPPSTLLVDMATPLAPRVCSCTLLMDTTTFSNFRRSR